MSEPTGILSDRQILEEYSKGNIVIFPFNPEQPKNLGNASLDITLGPHFYRKNPAYHGEHGGFVNPFCSTDVRNYWGSPQKASKIEDLFTSRTYNLPVDSEFIVLNPHETILVHSNEYVGARRGVNTLCRPRSTLGRAGISVITGGYGDVGFFSRWTLALHNNTNLIMILPVGERICQIVFFWAGETNKNYTERGQYQTSNNLEEVIRNWTPDAMLPNAPKPPK